MWNLSLVNLTQEVPRLNAFSPVESGCGGGEGNFWVATVLLLGPSARSRSGGLERRLPHLSSHWRVHTESNPVVFALLLHIELPPAGHVSCCCADSLVRAAKVLHIMTELLEIEKKWDFFFF